MFPFSKGKGAAAAGVGVRAESCRQSVGGAGYTASDGGGPISRAPLSLTRRRVRLLLSLSRRQHNSIKATSQSTGQCAPKKCRQLIGRRRQTSSVVTWAHHWRILFRQNFCFILHCGCCCCCQKWALYIIGFLPKVARKRTTLLRVRYLETVDTFQYIFF